MCVFERNRTPISLDNFPETLVEIPSSFLLLVSPKKFDPYLQLLLHYIPPLLLSREGVHC